MIRKVQSYWDAFMRRVKGRLAKRMGYEILEQEWVEDRYEPSGMWLYPDLSVHLDLPPILTILKGWKV